MAHEIEKFAYIGQKAWHGLGQKMEEGVPIEVWKEAAGLSHTVLESPVAYLNSYSNYETYMDNKVLYRSDTNKPLSVVSNKYQTVQPAQITGFFEGLVSELGFKMSTMGCLREGKVLFALAEIPESFSIKGDGLMAIYFYRQVTTKVCPLLQRLPLSELFAITLYQWQSVMQGLIASKLDI